MGENRSSNGKMNYRRLYSYYVQGTLRSACTIFLSLKFSLNFSCIDFV